MRTTASRLTLLSVVVALVLLAQPVSSQDDVPITDLMPLVPYGRPSGINNLGQVAGWYRPPGWGCVRFLWTPHNGPQDLPGRGLTYVYINDRGQVVASDFIVTGGVQPILWEDGEITALGHLGGSYALPRDINEAGQVAGDSTTKEGKWHAFLWTPDGVMHDLGTLGGGRSKALAMNDLGWVVGNSLTADAENHASLWTPADGMRDLGTLGGSDSGAYDVNDVGQIVGDSSTAAGEDHAFLWTAEGGMQDLGTLGGNWSTARTINELGWVVGSSSTAGSVDHAFLWTPTDGMIDLGTLGGSDSDAYDINNLGQVIGGSGTGSGEHRAFFWAAEVGMIELGTLGGSRSDAVEINDAGQVLGSTYTASGELHAVVWTPRLSPEDQIRALISDIAELVDEGSLNQGKGNALTQKLDNALRMLEEGKTPATCGQLQAFVNQVESHTKTGALPEQVGTDLIDAANAVIGQICE